ncbi:MAG: hypothetical protein AB1333_04405 [Patescibacteria group bacterium]
MDEQKIKLYRWANIHWYITYDLNGNPDYVALCPKNKCHCELKKSKEKYSMGEYKYDCIQCDFKITLEKSIEEKALDLVNIIESQKYKDAEIINLDGELVRVQRKQITDTDYWADVKISKNKKDEVQLMILAGSKSNKDKTQLFLDPKNQRFAFDQNNDHPTKVFAKVVAKFKNSKFEISDKS